jgi:hypothetical protein
MKKILIWTLCIELIFASIEFGTLWGFYWYANQPWYHQFRSIWHTLHYPSSILLEIAFYPPPIIVTEPHWLAFTRTKIVSAFALCLLQNLMIVWVVVTGIQTFARKLAARFKPRQDPTHKP